MTDEKHSEHDDSAAGDSGGSRDKTVIIERKGGGAGWAIAFVLVVGVAVGAYFLSQSSARDALETEAITDAAGNVGEAAQQVGDAAQDAADAVSGND
ncbi:hypothetical protein [Parasphingopyxis lamellibrachiae]|uniref:Uncharacterized protein n=1 Tax=Parasphingopyxis lamellibrachiae TaxID=680125 RepID=A0A3D9FCA1_9SPHN|nr:hypothetical protein [Parasphingopyxis lamellibrachiae]RED15440.1 hypothetical protein DFR46_0433 [Parasphingopyxis lamellibrachiae]